MQWVFIIMCVTVVLLECLDPPSYYVSDYTYVNCLQRLYISHHIEKLTRFSVCFRWHIWTFNHWILSPTLVHDICFVLCIDFLQSSKICCIVKTINLRRLYQARWVLDLSLVLIDIIVSSIKVSNGYDFLHFPWEEVAFSW